MDIGVVLQTTPPSARVVDLARVMTPENRGDVLRRFSRTEPRPWPRARMA